MKRILILAVLLAGCDARRVGDPAPMKAGSALISVFTDRDTGCQYLGVYAESVTPRIAADGKTHMGCREVRR